MDDTGSPALLERRGATALVTLNRPRARNALDLGMRAALGAIVTELREDAAIKAVVLTGSGGAFCAGGDLRALSSDALPPAALRDRIRRLHVWFHHLVNLEKPVIAAVDGAAFGAGMNLALAADFILCSERARFAQVFARIGVVPDLGGFFLLPRIVGLQRAKELMFTAREVDPEEAKSLGIVHEIRPSATLLEDALAMAAQFHAASTDALGMAKTILNQSAHLDQHALAEMEAYAQAMALGSDYFRQAASRFLAKQGAAFEFTDPFVQRDP